MTQSLREAQLRQEFRSEIMRGYQAALCNSDVPGWTLGDEVGKVADNLIASLAAHPAEPAHLPNPHGATVEVDLSQITPEEATGYAEQIEDTKWVQGTEVPVPVGCLGDGTCTNPNCPRHGIRPVPVADRERVAEVLHRFDKADPWNDAGCNDNADGAYTSCHDTYLERADALLSAGVFRSEAAPEAVPDEAVWVASRVYREYTATHPSRPDGIHAALEAAAPYMARALPAPSIDPEALKSVIESIEGLSGEPHGSHGFDGGCPVCKGSPEEIASAIVFHGGFETSRSEAVALDREAVSQIIRPGYPSDSPHLVGDVDAVMALARPEAVVKAEEVRRLADEEMELHGATLLLERLLKRADELEGR